MHNASGLGEQARLASAVIRAIFTGSEIFPQRIARTRWNATLHRMTRHCWKCGWEWTLSGQPGRSESCPQCRSDLRVCLNCLSYDTRAAHQCRDRRAEPVFEKHVGNFCEYFEFIRRVFVPPAEEKSRAPAAREQLKKLLGD